MYPFFAKTPRKGAKYIAIFDLVTTSVFVCLMIYYMRVNWIKLHGYLMKQGITTYHFGKFLRKFYISISLSAFNIIFSLLLLFGAKNESRGKCDAWFWTNIVFYCALFLAFVIGLIFDLEYLNFDDQGAFIMAFVIWTVYKFHTFCVVRLYIIELDKFQYKISVF